MKAERMNGELRFFVAECMEFHHYGAYFDDLRDSFLKRDYVYLRTHEKGDFIEIFSTCRKSIEEMKQKKENHLKKYMEPEGQLSLFGNGIIQERNR